MTRQSITKVLIFANTLLCCSQAFIVPTTPIQSSKRSFCPSPLYLATKDSGVSVKNVQEASLVLQEWDQHYNKENISGGSLPDEVEKLRDVLPSAIRLLNDAAREERDQDSTLGRVMLGICASSTEEGIATLKSWVTGLSLIRGLLHGADKDGVPLQIEGGVYIKYNTGGFLTFSQIRSSGMGFDALWRPGDALLETYDGQYRGVYYQVELSDEVFRQYLVPLDIFESN